MILLMASCNQKPITLVNIDMKHNVGHVEKIIDVDEKQCKLISETQPRVTLQHSDGSINKMFDGGIWISKDDYFTLYEAWLKDCKGSKK